MWPALILTAIVLLVAPASSRAQQMTSKGPLSDESIAKLIVGRWEAVESAGAVTVRGVNDYRRGGTLLVAGTIEREGQSLPFAASGRWHVDHGNVVTTVERSSIPEVLRPGHTSRDHVLSIDRDVLRYRRESGKASTRRRLTDEAPH
jgi:hypothetical protein